MMHNLPNNSNSIFSGCRIIMHENIIMCCDKPFCVMSQPSERLQKLKEAKIQNFVFTVLYVDIEYLHLRKLDYGIMAITDYRLWNQTMK